MRVDKQLSLERVLRALAGFGLSQKETEVYIYLAREGPQKAETTAKSLSLNERSISLILENLLEKEIINKISEKGDLFSALPFDKVIDLLVKLHLEETEILEQNRNKILSHWKSLVKRDFAR